MSTGRTAVRMALVLLALFASAADAPASVVVPMTLAELSRDARVIVEAEVLAVHVTADTGRVERVVSLRVRARWKGDSDNVVHLRLPGGTHGRTHTMVTGVPSMRVGERFVLFLADSPGGAYRVLGLHQGAWRVQASPLNGAWLVGPAPSAHAAPGVVARGDGSRRVQSLDTFRDTVRAMAAPTP